MKVLIFTEVLVLDAGAPVAVLGGVSKEGREYEFPHIGRKVPVNCGLRRI